MFEILALVAIVLLMPVAIAIYWIKILYDTYKFGKAEKSERLRRKLML